MKLSSDLQHACVCACVCVSELWVCMYVCELCLCVCLFPDALSLYSHAVPGSSRRVSRGSLQVMHIHTAVLLFPALLILALGPGAHSLEPARAALRGHARGCCCYCCCCSRSAAPAVRAPRRCSTGARSGQRGRRWDGRMWGMVGRGVSLSASSLITITFIILT